MLSQDDNPASDASIQTRQTGGILTPLSDNSLNSTDGRLHGVRKRKRDGNTMEDLLEEPFVVRVSNAIHSFKNIYADLRTAIPFHGPCKASNAPSTPPFT
jgi:hypothetical protein